MTVLLSDGRQSLAGAFRGILDAFGSAIDPGRGVFLKPNIVFAAKPESGQITSPALVAALVTALRETYGDLDIVMGDGVAVGCDPAQNFRVSGFARLSQELRVPLLDLHESERRPVAWAPGALKLPSAVLDRTYINLPILKYSSACLISGALKNQKGLLSPATKKRFHLRGLHESIAELNAAVKPSLTILDCSRFFGPSVLISGDNCGEVDATACRLLGIEEPEHVRLARDAGVFEAEYPLVGDVAGVSRLAARPQAHEVRRLGRLRLWSNPRACTGCRALLRDAKGDLLTPGHVAAKARLLSYAARGAEVIMGSDPHWRKEHSTVMCVGTCTRSVAQDVGDCIYIPGCPPSLTDLYNHLSK